MNMLTSALLGENIRAFILNSTNMVQKAALIHNTSPVATAALGRTINGASIMGYMLKGVEEKLTFQINGKGHIKNILAVSNSTGNVKAYISDPDIEILISESGKLDVGRAIGPGELTIVRDMGLKEPYIGKSELVTSEIAQDLANYFAFSEQTPSVVSLGVLVDEYGKVSASGGLLVQLLPSATDEDVDLLEQCVFKMQSISYLINSGKTNEEILKDNFSCFDVNITGEKEVDLFCDCSREKMTSLLMSVGADEIEDMMEKDGNAQLVCLYCNSKYDYSLQELSAIRDELKK